MNQSDPKRSYWEILRTERAGFLTIIFCLLLFAFEEAIMAGQNSIAIASIFIDQKINTAGIVTLQSPLAGTFTFISLIIIGIAVYISFNSTQKLKYIYFGLFSFAALTQFGYWNALNRFFIASDFQTNITSPLSFWIDNISRFFDPIAFVPIAVYGLLLFLNNTPAKRGINGFLLIVLLCGGLGLGSAWLEVPNYTSISIPAFYRSLSQVVVSEASQSVNRDLVPVQGGATPTNNILLVIDESVRGSQLSLYGYGRPTTPIFDELYHEQKLGYWPDAISAATCSITSNAVIMTGVNQFPDRERKIFTNPTLFHYAKAMGYTTHYIDGQSSVLWTSLDNSDLLDIDTYLNPAKLQYPAPHTMDALIGERLDALFSESNGNFVVFNKVGVHAPYAKAFPGKELLWTDQPPELAHESFFDVVNEYDSAVRYNHDAFFGALLKNDSILENTVIVYTSDHSQNLGEFPDRFFHCGREKVELEIPLIIIGDADLNSIWFNFPAHHYHIFPTLLDLMQVPKQMRTENYAVSLLTATAEDVQPRLYLPSYSDFFTGEALPYDE